MAGVTGREVKMAFAKFGANSWGVPASVTKGIYFASDGGLKHQPNILTDDAMGQTFLGPHDVGDLTAQTPTLEKHARYEDFGYVLEALAMGSPATVALATSASGQVTSWRHVLDLSANIDGLGATFAMDKQRYVDELTSAKIHGIELEEGDGGIMIERFRVTGSDLTNISSVNINSTVAGATYPALTGRVVRKQGVFRMNPSAGGGLGASDAVQAEHIKFTFNRPQDAPNVYGQAFIAEPADNGFPEFGLEVTYPRMTQTSANSLKAALREAGTFKADWTFSGTYINSTDRYSLLLQFPHVQLVDFEDLTAGANQIKPKAMFALRLAPTSPTGMAFVNPVRVTRVQVNSVHAFA